MPFGPHGLLLVLGGAETPVDATNETIVEILWNYISMVDPVTKEWHTQKTSGTKPPTVNPTVALECLVPTALMKCRLRATTSERDAL